MKKVWILILSFLLLTGCDNKDNIRFKNEYEKLNDTLFSISVDSDNYIKYVSFSEVEKLLDGGTGLIYIGNEYDNECRQMVNILISAVSSTNLDTIYYYKTLELDNILEYIDDPQVPIVLFLYEGELSYIKGIGNNENLTDSEKDTLYEEYLDGIHKVLNDVCDDECND